MRAPKIAVLETGAGNIRSVCKALEQSGAQPRLCNEAAALAQADALVLPGVGAFANAARQLAAAGLGAALCDAVQSGKPYLGLCLGLQLLFEDCDEHGLNRGLGLLPGRVRQFPRSGAKGGALRVPHIGWNRVHWRGAHPLLAALPAHETYYFVHAYRALPACAAHWAGECNYGGGFAAAVAHQNIFAVQFHPEKSQRAGLRLLRAFVKWVQA